MSDKPKRQRKIPAKLLDGAVEETSKQHRTPKNKKLDLKKQPENTEEVEESLESIEKELAKPLEKRKSKKESRKKTPKNGPAVKTKDDWMTLIFGENGEKTTNNGKTVVPEETKDDSSFEENEAEEFISKGPPFFTKRKEQKSDSKRGRPRKQNLTAKTEAVTKIGNNMYFFTGPGGSGSPPPLVDNEDEDEESVRRSKRCQSPSMAPQLKAQSLGKRAASQSRLPTPGLTVKGKRATKRSDPSGTQMQERNNKMQIPDPTTRSILSNAAARGNSETISDQNFQECVGGADEFPKCTIHRAASCHTIV